jgi:glycosyltransferase involved in cell wall biosynthesis
MIYENLIRQGNNPPLLVFADDWERHPSSCQHLIGRLLDRHEVWWVNTIGMRRPGLDWATVSRGLEKVGQWLRPKGRGHRDDSPGRRPTHPHLHVLNPRMWPSFGSSLERRINRELLVRQLLLHVAAMPEPPVVVTTIPIVADLVGRLPARRWVYYCVDDFAEWPGLDGTTLRTMEDRLIERVDVLIAVSPNLREKLGRSRHPVHLLTHGVDLEFWDRCHRPGPRLGATGPPHETPRARAEDEAGSGPRIRPLDDLERPLIVFWGVIDRRMDVAFLGRLANDLTAGTIVLIGPESDPDPGLARLPRVVRHTAVPLSRLPDIAAQASVLIMPYADLPVTRAMQPLKLKEYLATGRPVVVRDLPATRAWSDALDLAATPESFSRAVAERLTSGLPASQVEARSRLAEETWTAKSRAFEGWLFAGDVAGAARGQNRPHTIEACT